MWPIDHLAYVDVGAEVAVVAVVGAVVGAEVVGVVVEATVVVGATVEGGATVVAVCVVVDGVVLAGGVWVWLVPPLVSSRTTMMTTMTTRAARPTAIHNPRPRFCGRYCSVQAVPSQNRSTFWEPPGSGYHPGGWDGPGGCRGIPPRI